eukprot:PRCOL_00004937-RA
MAAQAGLAGEPPMPEPAEALAARLAARHELDEAVTGALVLGANTLAAGGEGEDAQLLPVGLNLAGSRHVQGGEVDAEGAALAAAYAAEFGAAWRPARAESGPHPRFGAEREITYVRGLAGPTVAAMCAWRAKSLPVALRVRDAAHALPKRGQPRQQAQRSRGADATRAWGKAAGDGVRSERGERVERAGGDRGRASRQQQRRHPGGQDQGDPDAKQGGAKAAASKRASKGAQGEATAPAADPEPPKVFVQAEAPAAPAWGAGGSTAQAGARVDFSSLLEEQATEAQQQRQQHKQQTQGGKQQERQGEGAGGPAAASVPPASERGDVWGVVLKGGKVAKVAHGAAGGGAGAGGLPGGGSASGSERAPAHSAARPGAALDVRAEARKSPVDRYGKVKCLTCGRHFPGFAPLEQHLKDKHGGVNSETAKLLAAREGSAAGAKAKDKHAISLGNIISDTMAASFPALGGKKAAASGGKKGAWGKGAAAAVKMPDAKVAAALQASAARGGGKKGGKKAKSVTLSLAAYAREGTAPVASILDAHAARPARKRKEQLAINPNMAESSGVVVRRRKEKEGGKKRKRVSKLKKIILASRADREKAEHAAEGGGGTGSDGGCGDDESAVGGSGSEGGGSEGGSDAESERESADDPGVDDGENAEDGGRAGGTSSSDPPAREDAEAGAEAGEEAASPLASERAPEPAPAPAPAPAPEPGSDEAVAGERESGGNDAGEGDGRPDVGSSAAPGAKPAAAVPNPKPTTFVGEDVQVRYVDQVITTELNRLVVELLKELLRFQARALAKDPAKAKQKKRLVSGLREVTKGVKLGRAKAVVVAPNVEEVTGEAGLDSMLSNIITLARERGIPVVFALTRNKLGAAMGRRARMSAVAMFDYSGADEQFKAVVAAAKALAK